MVGARALNRLVVTADDFGLAEEVNEAIEITPAGVDERCRPRDIERRRLAVTAGVSLAPYVLFVGSAVRSTSTRRTRRRPEP